MAIYHHPSRTKKIIAVVLAVAAWFVLGYAVGLTSGAVWALAILGVAPVTWAVSGRVIDGGRIPR